MCLHGCEHHGQLHVILEWCVIKGGVDDDVPFMVINRMWRVLHFACMRSE
jgi:hypothetical protein